MAAGNARNRLDPGGLGPLNPAGFPWSFLFPSKVKLFAFLRFKRRKHRGRSQCARLIVRGTQPATDWPSVASSAQVTRSSPARPACRPAGQ